MATSFSYAAVNPSGADVFKHFLSLAGPARQTHLGSFTIASGDTTAVITGVGFTPEWILIFDDQSDAYNTFIDSGVMGLGMAAGADQWCGRTIMGDLSGYKDSAWYDNFIINNATEAAFTSFDADGFTLTVSATVGAGQLFTYICGRGEGNYAVGTDLSPAADGTQSIVCGFEPTSLFVSSTMVTALGDDPTNSNMCIGAGDIVTGQWNTWAGDSGGDIFNNQAEQPMILTFWKDAQPSGPFQPDILSEAELISFDPGGGGGFTLDWTVVDGVQRYFSWFALDGDAEVGRWVYNHAADGETGIVPTNFGSKGLIFFNNEVAFEGSLPEPNSGSLSIGIGACDRALDQAYTSYMGIDFPAFSTPRSVREMQSGYAFGCYARRIGGTTTPNNPENIGYLFRMGEGFVPQIYRRVFNVHRS